MKKQALSNSHNQKSIAVPHKNTSSFTEHHSKSNTAKPIPKLEKLNKPKPEAPILNRQTAIYDDETRAVLFEVLVGIQDEMGLQANEMAQLLKISPANFSQWVTAKAVKANQETNFEIIRNIIKIYDLLGSFLSNKEAKIEWFKNKNPRHINSNKSPFETAKDSVEGLISVRQRLEFILG